MHSKSIEELAPALVPFVNKLARSRRTVNEAMQDLRWVGDIAGGLSVPAILDYLELWDTLENVQLLENQPDQHLWTPESWVLTPLDQLMLGSLWALLVSSRTSAYGSLGRPFGARYFSGWPCSIGAGQRIG